MRLDKDLEIVDGLPFLYVKSLDALVCSDVHLGYEGVMAGKGVFVPKVNLKRIKEMTKKAVLLTGAKTMIVDGDIKNEFSEVHIEEFNEFREFMRYLAEDLHVTRAVLVKGNHDNFIERLKPGVKFESFSEEALLGRYLFFHGDELPASKKGSVLIMGHLHPSIAIYDKLGVKEKLRCFLYGKLPKGRELIVLPAANYFAEGVDTLREDCGEIAPIFKDFADVGDMRALCIGEGETLDFGTIRELRSI